MKDTFRIKKKFPDGGWYYDIPSLAETSPSVVRIPYSIKVLLESLVRNEDGRIVTKDHIAHVAQWGKEERQEIPFQPARVLMQDFTGVPAVVDLAAMRDAMGELGGNPSMVNPKIPVDLVIDHSVQVDYAGTMPDAFSRNMEREFERNRERYAFLAWGARAFDNFRVVPPGAGIVHQVNLEFLASVVAEKEQEGERIVFPDTLVGTDSHTPMVNALGVVGWGVGGIEAEAVMLGQPVYMLVPPVIGCRIVGSPRPGVTATDITLTIVEKLRAYGVVGSFVEFFGEGIGRLSLPDRATIANMAPEYGATIGFFPVDAETLAYLRRTGRSERHIQTIERYMRAQGLFREEGSSDPVFTDVVEVDLSRVEPSVAGPKRPQDRIVLLNLPERFASSLTSEIGPHGFGLDEKEKTAEVPVEIGGETFSLSHGSIVIAALTSCTNTSNPSVMVAAGLLAKKAAERGLRVPPYIKTSMAPGSRIVTEYLSAAKLLPFLEQLGFGVVGYGCTTCIGNSGPLHPVIDQALREKSIIAASILSGNRNFEGRVHPLTRANFLASPPLVIAFAIAGRIGIDFEREPLGTDTEGNPVFLKDIWPSDEEIRSVIKSCVRPEQFQDQYAHVFEGSEQWKSVVPADAGERYQWDPRSTYIKRPPFFEGMEREAPPVAPISGARVLGLFGDSVTTDHISPAGAIAVDSPAGQYLRERGIEPKDFNSYGSRRGNDAVLTRGTFANVRIRNLLVPGSEGGVTYYLSPSGEKEEMSFYDAAQRYRQEGAPLIVLAGKEYGTGSSRDWAAKGPALLGVKAVIAGSFERIHRSNLIGMGILPLEFKEGEGWQEIGLSGEEVFDIAVPDEITPRCTIRVTARRSDGSEQVFETVCRLDTPVEVEYYQHGGVLQYVLRKYLA